MPSAWVFQAAENYVAGQHKAKCILFQSPGAHFSAEQYVFFHTINWRLLSHETHFPYCAALCVRARKLAAQENRLEYLESEIQFKRYIFRVADETIFILLILADWWSNLIMEHWRKFREIFASNIEDFVRGILKKKNEEG